MKRIIITLCAIGLLSCGCMITRQLRESVCETRGHVFPMKAVENHSIEYEVLKTTYKTFSYVHYQQYCARCKKYITKRVTTKIKTTDIK